MSDDTATGGTVDNVALVTGASRGIGKAIAVALGEAGFTVYVTARAVSPAPYPGTVAETAALVDAAGGRGVAVACDHSDEAQITALFERIATEKGHLDVCVNNVFPTDAVDAIDPLAQRSFWEQPATAVDGVYTVGVRSHYLAAWHAVRLMLPAKRGLVINISSAAAVYSILAPAYTMSKAAIDKLTVDVGRQLRPTGLAIVSLWPGPWVGTELVLEQNPGTSAEGTESPVVTARAVAALATDAGVGRLNGKVLVAADVLAAYGGKDGDGSAPTYPFNDDEIRGQLLKRLPSRLRPTD